MAVAADLLHGKPTVSNSLANWVLQKHMNNDKLQSLKVYILTELIQQMNINMRFRPPKKKYIYIPVSRW